LSSLSGNIYKAIPITSPALAGFFVYRHFSLHSTDGIRMSKRKHIEKIDERVDR